MITVFPLPLPKIDKHWYLHPLEHVSYRPNHLQPNPNYSVRTTRRKEPTPRNQSSNLTIQRKRWEKYLERHETVDQSDSSTNNHHKNLFSQIFHQNWVQDSTYIGETAQEIGKTIQRSLSEIKIRIYRYTIETTHPPITLEDF